MRSAESRDDEELLSSSSKRCCVGLPPAVGVGLFSAVGGLLFGLDIGYIAGVEAMASFRADVDGGRPLGDWTAGTVTGAAGKRTPRGWPQWLAGSSRPHGTSGGG